MRMQHWSKWVWALMVTVAGVASTQAQEFSEGTAGGGVNQTAWAEGGTANAVPGVNPASYPGYSNEYGAYPVAPWPEVSPYDYSVDQTYYDNGLWYRHQNRRQTRHFFGVDYFSATLKRPQSGQPGGRIGINTRNDRTAYAPFGRLLVGSPEDLPQKTITDDGDDFYFPHTTEAFGSDEPRPGVIIRYGLINADDSGFEVTGFYASSDEQSISYSKGTIDRLFDPLASVGEVPDIFSPTGVPLDVYPDSGRLVYSDQFTIKFDSKAWGAQANFITTPIRSQEGAGKFSALFGVTYLGISEHFGIEGVDSGTSNPVSGGGRVNLVDPHTMLLASRLKSQLVGPQFGLRWVLGGKKLKLTTEIKGAFAANFESRSLAVDNYGPTSNAQAFLIDGSDTNDAQRLYTADPTYARLKEDNVGFSPVLEASFMASMPIMQYLPIVNKMPGFRSSEFRIGYTFTQAWQIARAAQSVEYSAPLPRLTTDRDSWHIGGLVAGFTWTY